MHVGAPCRVSIQRLCVKRDHDETQQNVNRGHHSWYALKLYRDDRKIAMVPEG